MPKAFWPSGKKRLAESTRGEERARQILKRPEKETSVRRNGSHVIIDLGRLRRPVGPALGRAE
jgi:hypothetical protein